MDAARPTGARPVMITRILVAVEDSTTGLRTADVAVDLAATLGAELRAVHVQEDGQMVAILMPGGDDGQRVIERRCTAVAGLLQHVSTKAGRAGVVVETRALSGHPAPRILDAALAWSADLIVIGRSEWDRGGPHCVGGGTRHVLEFAQMPVLVVLP